MKLVFGENSKQIHACISNDMHKDVKSGSSILFNNPMVNFN